MEKIDILDVIKSETKTKILSYIASNPNTLQKEISEKLHLTQPAVSQHLKYLEKNDFVRKRRRGWEVNKDKIDTESNELVKFAQKIKNIYKDKKQ